jgi:hypothetical protein
MCRFKNHIGDVMINVLAIKDYNIGICCFSARHAALRRKSKDWLARNRDNVCPSGRHVYYFLG